MPDAIRGTREPTAKNFVATAMPKCPVDGSQAMIDQVIGGQLSLAESSDSSPRSAVIAGLVPAISLRRDHTLLAGMAATSPAMTSIFVSSKHALKTYRPAA